MESSQVKDLRDIFGNHIGTYIFDTFLEILDSILSAHPREVYLKTRNDEGQILSSGNVQYFSLVSPQKSKPVICAGATEPRISKHPIPVIRFTNTNPYLKISGIPQKNLFPYSKPDWTYVCLNGDTILSVKKLIEEQINIFYERPTDPAVLTQNEHLTPLTHGETKSPAKISPSGYSNGTERQNIRVSLWLAIGILFMPFIFAWVTFQKGYSYIATTISAVWLVVVIVAFVSIYKNKPDNQSSSGQSSIVISTPQPADTLTSQQKLSKAKSLSLILASKEDLKEAAEYLKGIPSPSPEYKESRLLLKTIEKRLDAWYRTEQEDAKALELLGPRPTNNPWDAKVREVDEYLENNANDYHSIEYISWSPVSLTTWEGNQYWSVRCKFRGANAFGGTIINEKIFLIRKGQVVNVIDY